MPVRRRPDNGHWLLDFRVRGARHRETLPACYNHLTKRQVEALERERRFAAEQGGLRPERSAVSWGDAAAEWWNTHAKFLGWASTVKWHLNVLGDAIGDETALTGLNAGTFASAVAQWRTTEAPRTVNIRLRVASSMLNHARDVQGHTVPTIPWRRLHLEVPDVPPKHVAPAVRDAIMAQCSPHVRHAMQLALAFGVRRGSILGLRWEDIDWVNETVTFRGKSRKPGGAVHILPMVRGGRAVLEEIGPQPSGHVITWRGRPVASIKTAFNRAKRDAGHPTVQFKDLRSTFGREVLAQTGNMALASRMLGHSGVAVTQKHYARFLVEEMRLAMGESKEKVA